MGIRSDQASRQHEDPAHHRTASWRTDSCGTLDHETVDSLDDGHRNEVMLIGRLAADIQERTMPSGAVLCSFRLVVRRAGSATLGPNLDTLDCVAWGDAVQKVVRRWSAGDLVEVRGALRRRFWRSATGSVSRCEIETAVVRRLARGAPATSRRTTRARAAERGSEHVRDQRAGPPVPAGTASSA
jgi:single-strand DNA-binding protein